MQLRGLRGGFTSEELSRAREYSKGRLQLRMEDSHTVVMWQGGQELLKGEVSTVDEVVDSINAVTVEDVNRVANQIVQDDLLNLAVVGPFRSDRRFHNLIRQ